MEATQQDFICQCGQVIPEDNMDYSIGESDGDSYTEVSAYCDVCKREYETSSWGEYTYKQEIKELLIDNYSR